MGTWGPELDRLPEAYAAALRMAAAGAAHQEIAEAIGVDAAAVPSLLAIGERKAAALLAAPHPAPTEAAGDQGDTP